MSKKKNTLRELDEFLKQQAATLVLPKKLAVPDANGLPESREIVELADEQVPMEIIIQQLREQSAREGQKFNEKLYDLIIASLESRNSLTPEDRMLINTALYLKSGPRWKDVIRSYWREQKL